MSAPAARNSEMQPKTTATYKTWEIPLYLWKGDGNILCLIHSVHRQTPLATTQKPLQTNWAQQNVTTVSYKHYIHLQVGNTLSRIFRTIAERAGVAIEKKNTHIDNIVLEKRDAFQFWITSFDGKQRLRIMMGGREIRWWGVVMIRWSLIMHLWVFTTVI